MTDHGDCPDVPLRRFTCPRCGRWVSNHDAEWEAWEWVNALDDFVCPACITPEEREEIYEFHALEAEADDADDTSPTEQGTRAKRGNSGLHPGLFALAVSSAWWTPRLGRKTHAAVVPADYADTQPHRTWSSDIAFDTLCGRGLVRDSLAGRLALSEVDCVGCWNALVLGGFLETPFCPEDSDWLLTGRDRQTATDERLRARWEREREAREATRKRELHSAVEHDLERIRRDLGDV